jgi:ABC-type multidrug transport system permease subunit
MNKIIRLNQLWQLISALFHEIVREPGVIFWGILFPILMSLGLGLAFTRKSEEIHNIGVVKSLGGHEIGTSDLSIFLETKCSEPQTDSEDDYKWKYYLKDDKLGNSVFYFYELDWNEAIVKLKRGTISLILMNNSGETEYHFDPLNSDAKLTYLRLREAIKSADKSQVSSNTDVQPLTVNGTRYIDFLVPGLITMGVMMSTMWGISYGLIEKRSKKLLRRLIATPMKKSHFLIALISVRLTMNFIEAIILILFSLIVFNITIQGSISALVLIFLAGNIAFAGISVFVSCHTSNTEVGNGLINVVVMPMMILSGIFFSYHNFPDWSVKIIRTLPLTMLTDGVRSIFNEGAGFNEIIIPALVLSAIGIISFSAALKVFKWY